MRPRKALALLLLALLLPAPLPVASASSVTGPDGDGAFLLRFDVERAQPGPAALGLAIARHGAEGDANATRDLGERALPAGASVVEVAFLPAEGAGQYVVTLLVDGAPSGELSFLVEDTAAEAHVGFDVPDEQTYLNLTSDEVNAANKTKSPGEALVTRARLSDGNGLSDVSAVAWVVEGPGFTDRGALNVTGDLELRYDRAPLPAGDHTLTLFAQRDGATLASASRTFRIRDVAPTFLGGSAPTVAPDEPRNVTGSVTLADRNGFPTAPLELRVYRGSTRVDGAGFSAALGAALPLPDANGSARALFPLELGVPARATPGAHRVSIYANGTLLGVVPFEVLELPSLANVTPSMHGGDLLLTARGAGNGTLRVRLDEAVAAGAAFVDGAASLRLDAPRRNATLAWNATLHARADGPAIGWRNGTWVAPLDGPPVTLTPLQARRLPAAWRVETSWRLEGATVDGSFTRWDGAHEPRLAAVLAGDRLRLDGPNDLEAGRYTARLLLTWPNGSASEAVVAFDAGRWAQLSLGAPVVVGRVARVPVVNDGGLAVQRVVVEAEPAANLTLETAEGSAVRPTLASGRAVFSGVELVPGATATLRVELPSGPLASGRHDVRLRVLGKVDLA